MNALTTHNAATPGPWKVADGSDQLISNGQYWIASTMGIRGEQGAANARLIAAAPTMLDELEMLASGLHMLIRAIDEGDPISEIRFRAEDMKREAKAAIAKATGGAL